jgi:hypothetical protein
LIDRRLGFQKNFWSEERHSAQMRTATLCFKSGYLLSTVSFFNSVGSLAADLDLVNLVNASSARPCERLAHRRQ